MSLRSDAPAEPDTNALFPDLSLDDRLRLLRERVAGRIVFTTSFGLEDQAITHAIARAGLAVEFVTLDTGRMFPETYELWAATERHYGVSIRAVYPRGEALEALVARDGIDGFTRSVAARKDCCAARKVEPLGRALAGAEAWITGLRAGQSTHRSRLSFVARDDAHGLLKANPVLDWSRDDLVAFTREHGVPVNPLHARGFLSIGCAPCTRAVQPGEPERAGRWWWEQDGQQECGLHLDPDGRLIRTRVPA